MKREELKYFDCNEDSYDSCGFKFEPMEVYDKAEADSVMDAMEARIKELKRANRAHLIELGDAEKCFEAKEACIKELEAENKALRFNLEDWKHKAEEMEVEKLQERIKELNAENIVKDMVGAELHNENKDLRHNLEDYKCENEALKQRIKELERVCSSRLEEVNRFRDYYSKAKDRLKELESRRLKWISVEERFPTTDEYDGVLVDLHEVSDYPIAGVERIRTVQFITDSIEYDADNNCGIFKNVEGMEKCWFSKWMPLPEAPTTEESSVIEEG